MIDRTHASPSERLMRGITISGTGCWEWQGFRNKKGYGKIKVEGKCASTHRLSWEIHKGEIPDGMLVCHSCDNPSCVHPEHLFLGTTQDNMADMVSKGRQSRLGGERNPRNVLKLEDVREIRAAQQSLASLARKYGVHHNAIHAVKTGRNWGGYL